MLFVLCLYLESLVKYVDLLLQSDDLLDHRVNQLALRTVAILGNIARHLSQPLDLLIFVEKRLLHP